VTSSHALSLFRKVTCHPLIHATSKTLSPSLEKQFYENFIPDNPDFDAFPDFLQQKRRGKSG
jgi:hypothetical protein